jgi:predicted nucleic acid-binding protein
MRVFLDANILFSAAKSAGAVRALLEELLRLGHDCCADAYVVEEARRNLVAKAPAAGAALDHLLRRVSVAALQPSGALPGEAQALPEKDRPVFAGAMRSGCDVLLTGDRTHFGAWFGKRIAGVAIHSPRSLAEALPR